MLSLSKKHTLYIFIHLGSSFGNSRHQGKCTKQTFVPPTISSTNAAIKAQKHGEATNEILVKAQKQFELSTESVSFPHTMLFS